MWQTDPFRLIYSKRATAVAANELGRREFLWLAIVGSAMLMGPRSLLDGAETDPRALHGALRELAPGAVRPEGWLRGMLEKQAAQLGSKLPQIAWPFTGAYWAGEEKDESTKPGQSWFPWEQKAYWIDGAARLALVLGDERLIEQVWTTINYTLTHADADGYLGPKLLKDPQGACHRWPHNVFFRSLMACADGAVPLIGGNGENIVEALRKHYLNDQALYGSPERNITNLEPILWC